MADTLHIKISRCRCKSGKGRHLGAKYQSKAIWEFWTSVVRYFCPNSFSQRPAFQTTQACREFDYFANWGPKSKWNELAVYLQIFSHLNNNFLSKVFGFPSGEETELSQLIRCVGPLGGLSSSVGRFSRYWSSVIFIPGQWWCFKCCHKVSPILSFKPFPFVDHKQSHYISTVFPFSLYFPWVGTKILSVKPSPSWPLTKPLYFRRRSQTFDKLPSHRQ